MSAWAAIGQIASSIGGDFMKQHSAKSAAHDAYIRETKLRSTAYQDTMEDMRAAGLNPILAYKTGATNTPSAPMANTQGVGTSVSNTTTNALSAKLLKEQIQTELHRQNQLDSQSLKDTENASYFAMLAKSVGNDNIVGDIRAEYLRRNPWLVRTQAFGDSLSSSAVTAKNAADVIIPFRRSFKINSSNGSKGVK
jgi:hypothetical protein